MIMVFLWVRMEETNPDPSRATKYPIEITRKSEPASTWLMPISFSIAGIKGEKMILEIKFRKKIDVRKRSCPICERNKTLPESLFIILNPPLPDIIN